jgi:hypothetical protein
MSPGLWAFDALVLKIGPLMRLTSTIGPIVGLQTDIVHGLQ